MKNVKKIFVLLVLAVMALGMNSIYAGSEPRLQGDAGPLPVIMSGSEISMTLNGKPIIAEVQPFIENGRTMVPVRFISEAFGASVDWNDALKLVTITAGEGTNINLTIGSNEIIIN